MDRKFSTESERKRVIHLPVLHVKPGHVFLVGTSLSLSLFHSLVRALSVYSIVGLLKESVQGV